MPEDIVKGFLADFGARMLIPQGIHETRELPRSPEMALARLASLLERRKHSRRAQREREYRDAIRPPQFQPERPFFHAP